jgi:hypothetical protein
MRLAGRPVMKLWTVLSQRDKEVEEDHCKAFLCVAGKSESCTSFSCDRFLLCDIIFDLRQLCLNRWCLNLTKRFKLMLIVFRQRRTIYCYSGLHELFRFLHNDDVSSTLFTICG